MSAEKEKRTTEKSQRDLRMKLLTQIEGIDGNLNNVKEDMKRKMEESNILINNQFAEMNIKFQGLEVSLTEKIDNNFKLLLERQEAIFRKMEDGLANQHNDVAFFKTDAADLIEKVTEVSDKIMDFEKNKRNNLIFCGIPNDAKETPSMLDNKVPKREYL